MQPGRLWRTVRHLSADQWVWRLVCRGRRVAWARFPAIARNRIEAAARRLPVADPGAAPMAEIADAILLLQRTVHGESFAATAEGRFRLLGEEFDFGSIDRIPWRGDFREGTNPLRRMTLSYLGYCVPLLATGQHKGLDATARLVRSLEAGNPWTAPGALGDVWNPYAASHRILNLLSGLALYRRAGGAADETLEAGIVAHVRFCAALVRAALERDIQFNHLLKNLVALSAYGAACGVLPPALAFLRRDVPRAVAQCVLADGGHAERSPMYHALGLLDLRVLAATGLFPEAAGVVRRMEDALAVLSLGDGEIALFNDSWIGEAPPAAVLAGGVSESVTRLPVAGYVRLGSGSDSVVFDCGPCGPDENPGHAHADFLSVEATVGGRRFLVDTGVPSYTAGPPRDASRTSAAHNGPRIGGAEPIEFWKSFRVGRRGDAGELDPAPFAGLAPLVAAGWQSGYAHVGTDVRRLVALWPGRALLLCDLWQGDAAAQAAADFLIPANWQAEAGGAFTGAGLRVSARALRGRFGAPLPASHWMRYGIARPAHRLPLRPVVDGRVARAAVLFAWVADMDPPGDSALEGAFAALAAAPRRSPGGCGA
jgi:hypothetical protein